MDEIKDLRHDLIKEIMQIESVETLTSIHHTIEWNKEQHDTRKSLSVDDAIVEVRKGWTLNQIVAEQDITPITYPEIKTVVENIAWEVSLEALLASID